MFLIEKLDVKFLLLIFPAKKWAQWRWKLLFAELCTWWTHTSFWGAMISCWLLRTQTPCPACSVSKDNQFPLLTDQQVAGNGIRAVQSLPTMGSAYIYFWHMCWYLHNMAVPKWSHHFGRLPSSLHLYPTPSTHLQSPMPAWSSGCCQEQCSRAKWLHKM